MFIANDGGGNRRHVQRSLIPGILDGIDNALDCIHSMLLFIHEIMWIVCDEGIFGGEVNLHILNYCTLIIGES